MHRVTLSLLVVASSLGAVSCISIYNSALSPFCPECKEVVGSIQRLMVSANKSYEDIVEKNLEDHVCRQLPEDVQASCNSIVSQQIPAIWSSIITEYLDPTQTCTAAHLCGPSVYKDDGVDPVTCRVCKRTAEFIDMGIFEDPLMQRKIAAKLKHICSEIPKAGNATIAQCDKLIDDDIADIMTEVGKAVAMNMCVDLGMCNEMTASPACHVCDGLVKKIQVAISAPTSYFVEFFRGLIEQSICGSLESGAAACKDAAAGAAARAWSGAVSGLAPGKACRSCGSRAAAAAAGEGLVCHVCEKLALFIDSDVLEDPAVQKAVADQLKDLCAQLPNPRITNSSITAQCDKMVDENTAEIMSQVGKAVQARLCEDLVLCAA